MLCVDWMISNVVYFPITNGTVDKECFVILEFGIDPLSVVSQEFNH